MRLRTDVALAGLLAGALVLLVSGGLPIASGDEAKTTADPVVRLPVGVAQIWNFHYHEKVRKGNFIELAQLDSQEARGRSLVITHLELRMRQSTRVQVVEHRKDARKVRRDGKPLWNKKVRRGEGFSLGLMDSTTKQISSGYSTLVGMKFDPGTRASIEVTQGSGPIWIYAEGYWSH
ncbi:MAG: hypothetical protein ACYTEZ_18635 [Planctomycetota bacterium]|jgi:hypothetical protein